MSISQISVWNCRLESLAASCRCLQWWCILYPTAIGSPQIGPSITSNVIIRQGREPCWAGLRALVIMTWRIASFEYRSSVNFKLAFESGLRRVMNWNYSVVKRLCNRVKTILLSGVHWVLALDQPVFTPGGLMTSKPVKSHDIFEFNDNNSIPHEH